MSPAVTVYVDQVPVPYLGMTQGAMLDLDRLEVLKGPQGTLFGENSTAGAINCIAAKPSAEFHTGMDLTYGRFHEWDEDAFVSGPLSNSLTARLAVRNESRDGWQISESRSGDTLGTRSRVDRSFISQDPYGRTIDIQGEASPDTPRWQFVGDSEYARPITDRWSAFVGGSISHRTASFAAFGDDVVTRSSTCGLVSSLLTENGGRNSGDAMFSTNTTG
jgi:outer membrane receptor protein involved in Fe transport